MAGGLDRWHEEDRGHQTPCRIWDGCRNEWGYGRVNTRRGTRSQLAHKVVWESAHGPVPDGLELDHLCRVRECIREDHLEAVTRLVNARRGMTGTAARARMLAKTHCPHGHPYNEMNTYIHPKTGKRQCRVCRLFHKRQSYRRGKEPTIYINGNPKTKKEVKDRVKAGESMTVFQPNNMYGVVAPVNGKVYVAGPHFPAAHKWYAECELMNGLIVKVT